MGNQVLQRGTLAFGNAVERYAFRPRRFECDNIKDESIHVDKVNESKASRLNNGHQQRRTRLCSIARH
jgi:hypothetical protein